MYVTLGTIENYNALLQKKILDLEKQLLQNQTLIRQKSSLHCTKVNFIIFTFFKQLPVFYLIFSMRRNYPY